MREDREDRTLICEICGYQWDDNTELFFSECPVCESQMVHEMKYRSEPYDKLWW